MVILAVDNSLGIRSVTYYEQMLILLNVESYELILIKSAGFAVGGDKKLFIWNDIVSPAARSLENKLPTMILFWFCVPTHWTLDFTF